MSSKKKKGKAVIKEMTPVPSPPPELINADLDETESVVAVALRSIVTGEIFGPRIQYINEKIDDESSDDEADDSESDDSKFSKDDSNTQVPAEFWHLQKLIKYMKAGNQTATIVSLCLLKDYDLNNSLIQRSIFRIGGLEILVNLLETNDIQCQKGSLTILLSLSAFNEMRHHLIDLGIVTPLIDLLKHPAKDIQILATETLANIAMKRKARKQFRIRGGIPLILDVMDVSDSIIKNAPENLNEIQLELMAVAIGCAKVVNSLSSSPKVKEELRKYGVVMLLARYLKSPDPNLIIPLTGVIQQCADLKAFRLAFEQTGIISDVVQYLCSDNIKMQENCAQVLFKCAVNKETRTLVREAGGLDRLCELIKSDQVQTNNCLLLAVSGAIWKCAMSPENVARFNQNDLVRTLVDLLHKSEDDDVLANVAGALSECCKDKINRDVVRNNDGLPILIHLLNSTNVKLLENLPLVLKECAQSEECMEIINDTEHVLDGTRLLWSLLKHPSNVVKTNACLALVHCIKNAKDSAEMVRAFVGGLELIVSLLDSDNDQVRSAVCATIAQIATDPENLGILTDHGIVAKLANLVYTDDEELQANLTLAIAFCCEWGQNNYEFGKLNAVAPLTNYLTSTNKQVLKGVCIAFYHLSKHPLNCITMHKCGIVKHMLRLVGSDDPQVQIAAATTIRHIRKLALNSAHQST